MINKILTVMILISITGCDAISENKQLLDVVSKISKKNNCTITFENEITEESKNLILSCNCKNTNDLIANKILLLHFDELNAKNIRFDSYTIKDKNRSLEFIMSYKNLENVNRRKKLFENYLTKVEHNEIDEFYKLLDDKLKLDLVEKDFKKNASNLSLSNYSDFDGFAISSFEGKEYIMFRVSNGKKYIMMVFRLDDTDTKVHGFEII